MPSKNVKDFLTVNSLDLSTASILAVVGGELKRFTGQTIVIDASGNVGIGIAIPKSVLDLGSFTSGRGVSWAGVNNIYSSYSGGATVLATNIAPNLAVDFGYLTGATGTYGASAVRLNLNGIVQVFTDAAVAKTAGAAFTPTERLRIDSSGNVGIGITTPLVQTHIRYARSGGATNNTIAGLFLDAYHGEATAPTFGATIYLRSSRSDILGTNTISVNGDDSKIRFHFNDGTGFQPSAEINASVDGVPAVGSVAGKLQFKTTTAAATAPSTKMTIDKAGIVTITNLGTGTVSSTAGVLSAASDARMKISDGEIENAINKIQNLKPKYFYWKDENNNKDESKGRQLGFFAQEVNEQVPEAAPGLNDQWGIYDRSLIAVLVKAVQELKVEIDILKNK